jgi:hypothetical protein
MAVRASTQPPCAIHLRCPLDADQGPAQVGPDAATKSRQTCRGAMEQGRAKLALERPDGIGERGLRDTALLGSAGEVQLLAKDEKIAQLLQIHDHMRLAGIARPIRVRTVSWPATMRSVTRPAKLGKTVCRGCRQQRVLVLEVPVGGGRRYADPARGLAQAHRGGPALFQQVRVAAIRACARSP